MNKIKDKTFMICGTASNVENTLSLDLKTIHEALKEVKSIDIIIVESDSTDNTIQELEKLSKIYSNVRFFSLGTLKVKFPDKIDRIAHCRQYYFDYLNKNYSKNQFDYIVIYDLDGINNKLTNASFLSNWNYSSWDVVTANQNGPYYDVAALRHYLWCPNDFTSEYNFFKEFYAVDFINALVQSGFRKIYIPKNYGLIEVDSAFGGIAIYKAKVFFSSDGYIKNRKYGIDHVAFHKSITNKGYKIFINSEFINADYTEHTLNFKFGYRKLLLNIKLLFLIIFGERAYLALDAFQKFIRGK